MKIKPIVYSIAVAGMIAPIYAAYINTPAPKATCGMPSGMSATQTIIAGNSYNSGVDSNICWFNRVKFSGHIDVGYYNVSGERDPLYGSRSDNYFGPRNSAGTWNPAVEDDATTTDTDESAAAYWSGTAGKTSTKSFNLNQIVLAADARLAKNWDGRVVMRYGFDNTPIDYHTLVYTPLEGSWTVEEAYVTYSNPSSSPLFMKVGRGFVPFGHYANPFEFSPTMMQSLSQLREEYAQVGVASSAGLHASVSGWTSAGNSAIADRGDWKYVAALGFNHSMQGMSFDIDASYIDDINEVRSNRSFTHLADPSGATKDGAWQVGIGTQMSGLDLGLRYMSINTTNTQNIWGAHLGYVMNMSGHDNSLLVDYETANRASTPLDTRWSVGYVLGVSENVDAEFKYTAFTSQRNVESDRVPGADPKLWTVTLTGRF
jgi:hypothetical protein